MAAAVGGTTGAVLTGIVMISEMTNDYRSMLPVLLCVSTACAVRKVVSPESIYTAKLIRRGHAVPEGLVAAIDQARRVTDVMAKNYRVLPTNEPLSSFQGVTVLAHDGGIIGVLDRIDIPHLETGEERGVARQPFIVVEPHISLVEALRSLDAAGVEIALVSAKPMSERVEELLGVLTAREIASASKRTAELL
jgi:CIC family chloride channel protein